MRRIYTLSVILISLGIISAGCTTWQDAFDAHTPKPVSNSDLPDKYRAKALKYEEEEEIQKAIYYWKVAGALDPENEEISRKIIQLDGVAEWFSNRHVRKGAEYFKKGKKEKALEELLIALRYNPNNEEALYFIKERLPSSSFHQYRVLPKDTFSTIAKKVYRDPKKVFLIADLMGMEETSTPTPGTVILLPKLQDRSETPITIPAKTTAKNSSGALVFDYEKGLNLANDLYGRGEYQEALKYLYPLLAIDPKNKKAREILNQSCYELGVELERSENPVEALETFKKVEPGYLDIEKRIIKLKVSLKERAEEHYLAGLKYFVEEDIDKAIKEWDQTLYLDPEHEKGKKDLEKAKSILKKLEKVD